MTSSCLLHWRGKWMMAVTAAFLHVIFAPAAPAKPAKPEAKLTVQGTPLFAGSLSGIVVVPRWEDVELAGVPGVKGVVVKGPKFLQRRDFEKLLSGDLGLPLTDASLLRMQTNIVKYCRKRGHPVVDVCYREQEVLNGTIQIAVIEGKVGKVTVTNLTHKWFSDSIILKGVRLKPGDVVVQQRLDGDLNWVNRNSYRELGYFENWFREVTASLNQGTNVGQTDVQLQARERFPLRGFVGVDDSGIAVIGNERFFAGLNWANAFGLDQRLAYQYISDIDFNKFSEHVGSYVIPLPWRHELTLFGAYADVNPDYSVINPDLADLSNKGYFYQVSLRYAVPLPELRNYSHEITAGFDYKRTDTPLLFQSSSLGILRTNNIAVAQFMLGYSGRLNDRWGSTALSLQGFYSPGGLVEYNNQAAYSDFSPGSNPQYLYGRATLIRETFLPLKLNGRPFEWHARAQGQLSDARLVATEAFSLGGWDTVRGYDQNIVSGDNGWLLINELRTPRLWLFGNFHGKGKYDPYDTWGSIRGAKLHGMDWIQGLVFLDFGGAYYRNPPPQGWPSSEILLSVGAGFRYQLMQNFMVRFDYGWQLDRDYMNAPGAASLGPQPTSRAHFGLEASF
jgi:hemolysin activation/secretion protein